MAMKIPSMDKDIIEGYMYPLDMIEEDYPLPGEQIIYPVDATDSD